MTNYKAFKRKQFIQAEILIQHLKGQWPFILSYLTQAISSHITQIEVLSVNAQSWRVTKTHAINHPMNQRSSRLIMWKYLNRSQKEWKSKECGCWGFYQNLEDSHYPLNYTTKRKENIPNSHNFKESCEHSSHALVKKR